MTPSQMRQHALISLGRLQALLEHGALSDQEILRLAVALNEMAERHGVQQAKAEELT